MDETFLLKLQLGEDPDPLPQILPLGLSYTSSQPLTPLMGHRHKLTSTHGGGSGPERRSARSEEEERLGPPGRMLADGFPAAALHEGAATLFKTSAAVEHGHTDVQPGTLACCVRKNRPAEDGFSDVPEAVPQQGGTHQAEEKMLLRTSGGNRVTFRCTCSRLSTRARNTPTEKSRAPRITRLVVLRGHNAAVYRTLPGAWPERTPRKRRSSPAGDERQVRPSWRRVLHLAGAQPGLQPAGHRAVSHSRQRLGHLRSSVKRRRCRRPSFS